MPVLHDAWLGISVGGERRQLSAIKLSRLIVTVILILNPDGHNLDKLKVGLWHLQGGRDRPDLDMIKRFLTPQNYVTDILALAGHLSRAETFL